MKKNEVSVKTVRVFIKAQLCDTSIYYYLSANFDEEILGNKRINVLSSKNLNKCITFLALAIAVYCS